MNNLGCGKFELTFNSGRTGIVDSTVLGNEQPAAVFQKLKDPSFAEKAAIEHGTLVWPGELDIAAEYLYFLAFSREPELQETFSGWGYSK